MIQYLPESTIFGTKQPSTNRYQVLTYSIKSLNDSYVTEGSEQGFQCYSIGECTQTLPLIPGPHTGENCMGGGTGAREKSVQPKTPTLVLCPYEAIWVGPSTQGQTYKTDRCKLLLLLSLLVVQIIILTFLGGPNTRSSIAKKKKKKHTQNKNKKT